MKTIKKQSKIRRLINSLITTVNSFSLSSHIKFVFSLIGLFYLSLHPISSFLGGLFYHIYGVVIPSFLIFYIPWILVVKILKVKNHILSILLIILGSFILGVNVKLLYLTSPTSPVLVKSVVNKKLSLFKDEVQCSVEYDIKGMYIPIKKGLFYDYNIGSDEGCMCMYFSTPYSVFLGGFSGFDRHECPRSYFGSTGSIDENATYKISISLRKENKQNLADIIVKDINGGDIILTLLYPDFIIYDRSIMKIDRDKRLKSKYFFSLATRVLFNNNIWQEYLKDKYKFVSPLEYIMHNKSVYLEE